MNAREEGNMCLSCIAPDLAFTGVHGIMILLFLLAFICSFVFLVSFLSHKHLDSFGPVLAVAEVSLTCGGLAIVPGPGGEQLDCICPY